MHPDHLVACHFPVGATPVAISGTTAAVEAD